MQQFMLMFSSQTSGKNLLDFPLKDLLESILPGIGTNNWNAGSSEFEGDSTIVGENVLEKRQEIPTLSQPETSMVDQEM